MQCPSRCDTFIHLVVRVQESVHFFFSSAHWLNEKKGDPSMAGVLSRSAPHQIVPGMYSACAVRSGAAADLPIGWAGVAAARARTVGGVS